MHFISFILISGIVINLIILWFLSKKDKTDLSQKILKSFFVCIFFIPLNFYAELNNLGLLFVITFNFADTATLLIGPLLLIYVKSLFNTKENLFKTHRIHFLIPILYFFLISIPILLILVFEISTVQIKDAVDSKINYVFFTADLFLLVYIILSFRTLSSYLNITKSAFSNLKNKDLKWVKNMLIGATFLIIIDLIGFIYDFTYPDSDINVGFITIIFLVLFLYYLGYYGVKQSNVLVPHFLLQELESKTIKKSNLSIEDDKLTNYIKNIEFVIQEKQLYLNENLTLYMLAKEVDLKEKKLSAIINQKMNTTFYDLINSYRIEEFKKRVVLNEYEKITLLGIAYDCGFKSKSTFNRLFKQKTNLSPSAYKKMYFLN